MNEFFFRTVLGTIRCPLSYNSACNIFTTNLIRSSGHPRRASQFFVPVHFHRISDSSGFSSSFEYTFPIDIISNISARFNPRVSKDDQFYSPRECDFVRISKTIQSEIGLSFTHSCHSLPKDLSTRAQSAALSGHRNWVLTLQCLVHSRKLVILEDVSMYRLCMIALSHESFCVDICKRK